MNELSSTAYDIRMRTPIGVRLGKMTICRDADRLSGYLDILKHKEPFEGTIDCEGNCRLIGKIITLMRTIHYEAIGKITPDSLALSIADGQYVLKITGTAVQS